MGLRMGVLLGLIVVGQIGFASEKGTGSVRIVGGIAANQGEFPFLVSLQQSGRHFCGGSLIRENWVLTAAHCVVSSGILQKLKVQVGLHKQGNLTGVETFGATKIVVNPNYNASKSDFDWALVQLDGTSRFDPIAINTNEIEIPEDEASSQVATTAGWGATSQGGGVASSLMKVEVNLVSAQRCNAAYAGKITDNMICAGFDKGGKDSCQGDSGGPLTVVGESGERVLAGVVSWGEGCAKPKKFGVYSKVNAAQTWIENEIANAR